MKMHELRRVVWERQGGRCAATGLHLGDPDGNGYHLHHRLAGGYGGTSRDRDALSNLVCLLPRAHIFGDPRLVVDGQARRSVHNDPAWSRPLGLLLSANRGDDPAAVPVRISGVGWVFLRDDGGWTRLA